MRLDVVEVQPLAMEIFHRFAGARGREHSPSLNLDLLGRAEQVGLGGLEERAIGHRVPQQIRQS